VGMFLLLVAHLHLACALCEVKIAGMFQMRRSPASLQREAAARSSFCDRYTGCQPGFENFVSGGNQNSYTMWASDRSRGLNVSYSLYSESSATSNTDSNLAIENIISIIIDKLAVAIVGPNSSSSSKAIHSVAAVYGMPYISYASTSPELSDKVMYPQLFRVCPPDPLQAQAIVAFLVESKFERIVLMNTRDSYGSGGATAVEAAATQAGIKILTKEEFDQGETNTATVQASLKRVKETNPRVIVIFMSEGDAVNMLKEAEMLGMAGPDWTYVCSDGFTRTSFKIHDLSTVAKGFIGFAQTTTYDNTAFKEFNTTWTEKRNRVGNIVTDFRGLSSSGYYTGISTSAMPHNYDFFGEKKNGYANFAYDSMSMLLQAIENLADQGITPCTTSSLLKYRQTLTKALKNTTVSNGITGYVSFDSDQDRAVATYEMFNYDGTAWNRILSWDMKNGFTFADGYNRKNSPVWADGNMGFDNAPQKFKPDNAEPEGNSIYLYAMLGMVPVLAVLFYFVVKRKGEEWAELLRSVLQESLVLSMEVVLNIIDYVTDILSFRYVINTEHHQDLIIPYGIFLILAGLCVLTFTVLAFKEIRAVICGKDKYSIADDIKQHHHVVIAHNRILKDTKKHELEFLLNKAYHGITTEIVALTTAVFEDFPFMIINAVILMREGEVNLFILISFAFNCFICGTTPAMVRELLMNLDTTRRILEMIENAQSKRFSEIVREKENSVCSPKDKDILRPGAAFLGQGSWRSGKRLSSKMMLKALNESKKEIDNIDEKTKSKQRLRQQTLTNGSSIDESKEGSVKDKTGRPKSNFVHGVVQGNSVPMVRPMELETTKPTIQSSNMMSPSSLEKGYVASLD